VNPRILLQPAYILHARAYRDTSLLLDFLTLDHGLIRVLAKGVRGSRSKKRAMLQPLQPLLISAGGRGELLTLLDAEHAAPGFQLTGERLFSAMYTNELLLRLLHGQDAHAQIFRIYQATLLRLQQLHPVESVLRRFEMNLLVELGYAFDLESDATNGERISAEGCYLFRPDAGFEKIIPPTGQWPDNLYNGNELSDLAQSFREEQETQANNLNKTSARAAKRLMRQALAPHIGSKPLFSRTLFMQNKRLLPPEDNTG
jgi:DNA repair protein RecO (recombination protein O)